MLSIIFVIVDGQPFMPPDVHINASYDTCVSSRLMNILLITTISFCVKHDVKTMFLKCDKNITHTHVYLNVM